MATSTTTDPSGPAPVASARSPLGWAGIVFAVLFVVGFIMAAASPDTKASDADWLKWYADDSHLRMTIVGAYVLIAAGFAFLVLVAGLVERTASMRESSAVLHRVCWATGLLASGLMMLSAVQLAGIAGNITFGSQPNVTNVDVVRQGLGVAVLVLGGALLAAVFIATIATLARRSGVFGSGMTWFSYVVAVLLVLAVAWVPLVALPIWGLVTGIALLRKG